MGQLRTLSSDEVCSILRAHGFERVRQKGSHIVMRRRGEEGSRTVPVPYRKELKRGTLSSIIEQSGLPRELFETK